MTKQEVIKEIRSMVKPYLGIMKQSVFSITMRNIELGLCKTSTEREFFSKMGFSVVKEAEYEISQFKALN